MIPMMIRLTQIICRTLMVSRNSRMPKITVPVVPIPVHIAYAVPNGSDFKDNDKK